MEKIWRNWRFWNFLGEKWGIVDSFVGECEVCRGVLAKLLFCSSLRENPQDFRGNLFCRLTL